jgi:uncharacterized protein (TIGR03435 family)
MQQGRIEKKLLPGEQVANNPTMPAVSLIEEIQWSHNAVAHLALLQQSTSLPSPAPLQFEVASIKQPRYPSPRFACQAIDGRLELRGAATPTTAPSTFRGQILAPPVVVPTGRCVGQPSDIRELIAVAYGIPRRDVLGGPEWTQALPGSGRVQRWNIEAKAEDITHVTKEQLQQMLQSMLADRFKLKFHKMSQEVEGYALIVARGGPKLKEITDEEELPHDEGPPIGPAGADIVLKGKSRLHSLADWLSSFGPPIIDRTNLPGIYEYTFRLHQPPPVGGGQRGAGGGGGDGFDPPLNVALQEQLGLTLQKAGIPVDAIVIDEVEKPSEN